MKKIKITKAWVFRDDNGNIITSPDGRMIINKLKWKIVNEYPWWQFRAKQVEIREVKK